MNSPYCTGRSVLAKSDTSLIGLLACRPLRLLLSEARQRAGRSLARAHGSARPGNAASAGQSEPAKDLPKPHAPRRDDGKHASPGFAGQHIGGAGASKREKPDLQIKRS